MSLLPPVHPEIAEVVMLPKFTHWLLFPETKKYRPFIKAVTLDRHTNYQSLADKNIRVFPIGSRPQGYPTKPEYKIKD